MDGFLYVMIRQKLISMLKQSFARSYLIDFNSHYVAREKVDLYLESLAYEVGAEATEYHSPSEDSLMWVVFHRTGDKKWPSATSILDLLGIDSVLEMPMLSEREGDYHAGGLPGGEDA
jgi:hypothetical protein